MCIRDSRTAPLHGAAQHAQIDGTNTTMLRVTPPAATALEAHHTKPLESTQSSDEIGCPSITRVEDDFGEAAFRSRLTEIAPGQQVS